MIIFWTISSAMLLLAFSFLLVPLVWQDTFLISHRQIWGVVLLGVVLSGSAIMLYQKLGNPTAIGYATATPDLANKNLNQLADDLAGRLKQRPDDAKGWVLLAHTYVTLGRYAEAVPAFERAASMMPDDADLLADYAEVLIVNDANQAGDKLDAVVARVEAIDPQNPKILVIKGDIEFSRKNYAAAAANWEKLLALPGLDKEMAAEVRKHIDEAKRLAAEKPGSP